MKYSGLTLMLAAAAIPQGLAYSCVDSWLYCQANLLNLGTDPVP